MQCRLSICANNSGTRVSFFIQDSSFFLFCRGTQAPAIADIGEVRGAQEQDRGGLLVWVGGARGPGGVCGAGRRLDNFSRLKHHLAPQELHCRSVMCISITFVLQDVEDALRVQR
jgi:hypothetical protein